jgi:hypothetical protein
VLKGGTALFVTAIAGANETSARPAPVLAADAAFMQLAIA